MDADTLIAELIAQGREQTLTEDEKQEYLRNLEQLVTTRTNQLRDALAALERARDILNEALKPK